MIRITRKMGKRSYEYVTGTEVPEGWVITDGDGKTFPNKEEFEASLVPVKAVKTTAKKRATRTPK